MYRKNRVKTTIRRWTLIALCVCMALVGCVGCSSSNKEQTTTETEWTGNPFLNGTVDRLLDEDPVQAERMVKTKLLKDTFEDVEMQGKSTCYGLPGFEEGAEVADRAYGRTYLHWLTVNHNHLYLEITYPEHFDENKQYTTIVMAHGFQMATPTYIPFIAQMTDLDYIYVAFDFRGMGDYSKSDGALTEMTLDTLIGDMKAVTEYVRSLSYVDRDNLYLVGHSTGALAVACTASDVFFADYFRGIVLLAPAFTVIQFYLENYTLDDLPETFSLVGYTCSGEFIASCFRHDDYLREAVYYKNDLLVIVDEEDPCYTNEDTAQYAALFGDRCTWVSIGTNDHCFVKGDDTAAVVEQIVAFVRRTEVTGA